MKGLWQFLLCWSGLHKGYWIPTPFCVKCPHCKREWSVI